MSCNIYADAGRATVSGEDTKVISVIQIVVRRADAKDIRNAAFQEQALHRCLTELHDVDPFKKHTIDPIALPLQWLE